MDLRHEINAGPPPVTILHVAGRLDGSNYLDLIERVKELIAEGAVNLLMDLGECDFISSAGLFSLHNIALILHSETPLDPEEGWNSLRNMTEDTREFKDKFKIANLQSNVLRSLDITGFLSLVDVYESVDDGLAGFK